MLQIKGHCSYFGKTGFNNYSRGFFTNLKKLYPKLSIRNYSSFSNESINEIDKEIVDELTFYNVDTKSFENLNPPWTNPYLKPTIGDINIILNETNHPYFYENYNGISIAYNLWETTKLPFNFLNKLLEFDQVWVPSLWQKNIMLDQNFPTEKIRIIPGGVDNEFVPVLKQKNDIIKFLIVGGWSFRKSTREMIKSFLKVFKNIKNVELILSVDNPYNKDGMSSTEERLKYFGLVDDRIKIVHLTDRNSYIKLIQNCDVFLACSRGEGWNLPLIEALSCGIPSIYSDCSSHTEFVSSIYPLKVPIEKEIPAVYKEENIEFTGNYYEPNWNEFENMLSNVIENHDSYIQQHLELSKILKQSFSWEISSKKAFDLISPYLFKFKKQKNEFYITSNETEILEVNTESQNNSIYKEIFDYQVYNSIPEMKINRGDVVMDVGAHIGIFSRYADIKGASRIISIEMDPKLFSCLRLNVRPEDDIFNCVLLDKTFTRFKLDNDVLIIGFDLNYFYNGGLFNKIDFLKIDVSGKELQLLNSIKLDVYNVIKKISVKMYNLSDDNKQKTIQFMEKNGFLHFFNIIIPNQPIQFLYFWK